MTIKINGTNTTAQPSITGTDTDTGLVYGTDEVSIVTGGVEKIKTTNTGFDLNLDANTDSLTIENTAGDGLYFAPGMGLDDWSRQVFRIERKSLQASPGDVRATDVNLLSINASGNVYGARTIVIGVSQTDENSPVSTYIPDNNTGFAAYQGTTDQTGYRARVHLRCSTSDDDDLACFYYTDSNDATTPVDYDQDQTLRMTGSGRINGKKSLYAGRVESDEGSPNSVYNSSATGIYAYDRSPEGNARMVGYATPTSTQYSFYAETGTSTANDDIQFKVRATDGRIYSDYGASVTSGADYAESFEWLDGNPENEDRVGYSVVLQDGKIRKALDTDATSQIIGIISAAPAVLGDSADLKWQGRYLKDDFGREIMQHIELLVWNHGENEYQPDKNDLFRLQSCDSSCAVSEIEEKLASGEIKQWMVDQDLRITSQVRTPNPDFDPSSCYVPRSERPEWDPVGLMGKLWMRPNQPTGDRWLKLRDGNNELTYWLVR